MVQRATWRSGARGDAARTPSNARRALWRLADACASRLQISDLHGHGGGREDVLHTRHALDSPRRVAARWSGMPLRPALNA